MGHVLHKPVCMFYFSPPPQTVPSEGICSDISCRQTHTQHQWVQGIPSCQPKSGLLCPYTGCALHQKHPLHKLLWTPLELGQRVSPAHRGPTGQVSGSEQLLPGQDPVPACTRCACSAQRPRVAGSRMQLFYSPNRQPLAQDCPSHPSPWSLWGGGAVRGPFHRLISRASQHPSCSASRTPRHPGHPLAVARSRRCAVEKGGGVCFLAKKPSAMSTKAACGSLGPDNMARLGVSPQN